MLYYRIFNKLLYYRLFIKSFIIEHLMNALLLNICNFFIIEYLMNALL